MRISSIWPAALAAGVVLAGCSDNTETFGLWSNYGNGAPTAVPPTVTVDAATSAVAEGATVTVTVQLSNAFIDAVTVPFTVLLGTAGINDIDVTTASPVTIAAGATSATITIDVVNDVFEEEPDLETFTVTLGNPSSGTLGTPASVAVTISDDAADSDGLDGTISGRVVDALTGAPLANVSVSGGGTAASTGSIGRYVLTGVTPAASVLVTYTRTGYAPQAKATPGMVLADSAMILNVHMVPLGTAVPATFDPTTAQTIVLDASAAQIALGANALATAGGAAPSGTVTVQAARLLPQSDLGALPGSYLADAGGGTAPRESWGGLYVGFVDAGGNALQLATGQSATLRIPVSTRSSATPSTLTAHFLDPATGLWEAEGTLTLGGTAPSQYYEGAVTRLGTFSAMAAYTTASVTGCVVDPTGSPVPDAVVVVEGIAYTGSTTALTGADGTFTIPANAGVAAFVQASKRTGVSNAVTVVASQALSDCLLLVPGAAQIRLSWGAEPFDLDSHTYGPYLSNSLGHTAWTNLGSLIAGPFVALDVDDVDSFGPEVTTIVKAAQNRTYRFMVRNFSQSYTPGQTGSPARVELYIKGEQTVFTPPAGEVDGSTTTWHVFDMVSDANCDLTVVSPAPTVPWLSFTEGDMNDVARNPNPDDSPVFCN